MSTSKFSFLSGKKTFLFVFFLVNLLLASFYIDIWCTPNTVSRAVPVLSLLENGSFCIDKYTDYTADKSKVGDHFYSDKAPFPTIAAVPFYWLIEKAGLTKTTTEMGRKYPVYVWAPIIKEEGIYTMRADIIPILVLGSLLFGSIPFVIIIFLAFKKIQNSVGTISPVALVMLAFYGSFMLVFAGTYINHIIAGLLLLLGYIFIKDTKYLLSGLCVGLAFASEYTVAIAIPIWIFVIWMRTKSFKNIVRYVSGVMPSILFILFYNYTITGNCFTMLNAYHNQEVFQQQLSHNYGFAFPTLESLWGLSFSFYMGLIPYVPVLLLCGYFLIKEMLNKYPFKSLLSNYLAMFCIPFFLVISSFFTWWGGWSYGPRYLICMAVILVYEGVIYLADKKINVVIFFAVTGFGLICTWLAKVTLMYMIPDKTYLGNGPTPGGDSFTKYILPEFRQTHFNANNLLTFGLDVAPKTAAYIWILLFAASTIILSIWYKNQFGVSNSKSKVILSKGKTGNQLK